MDNWNKEHPDIQVEYVRYVNDDDGNLKLDTAMITGQDVDLFVNYTISHAAKRVESGLALDLSGFTDYNIEEKMGADTASWKIDGKFYGVPTTKSPFFIALNKDALDKAGLPVPKEWTWNELREYAKKLKIGNSYGFYSKYGALRGPHRLRAVTGGLHQAGRHLQSRSSAGPTMAGDVERDDAGR
ncbi:ABC transporter substrate-binding protein [Paenibacillus rhizoplanae]